MLGTKLGTSARAVVLLSAVPSPAQICITNKRVEPIDQKVSVEVKFELKLCLEYPSLPTVPFLERKYTLMAY